jgi:hypothetical protein
MALPVEPVIRPAALAGQQNGRFDDDVLVDVPGLAGGPTVRLVAPAARAWRALTAAGRQAGHTLKAVGPHDSYRPFATQERIFLERYTTDPLPGRHTKQFRGKTFFQKPGTNVAAVPGNSNHGLGLAVDTGIEVDGDPRAERIDQVTVDWLVANERRFGFSHELQSEPWHIRYFAGDDVPDAVLELERSGLTALEDDMPLSDADIEKFKIAMRLTLNEGTGKGQTHWPGTMVAILGGIQANDRGLKSLAGAVERLTQRVTELEAKLD